MTMVTKPSGIHGRGCFTDCYLRPGTEFDVPCYQTNKATDHSVTWEEDGDWWEFYHPYRFINHSENPNAELYLAEDGTWNLYILRKVRKDGEITIHYGKGWGD
jgi:hypothetical protein